MISIGLNFLANSGDFFLGKIFECVNLLNPRPHLQCVIRGYPPMSII